MKCESCYKYFVPRPWIATVSTAVVAVATLVHGTPSRAQEAMFADFPVVIYCQYDGIDHAYYFSQLGPDGIAVYLTPDRQAGSISLHGTAEPVNGERTGSCADKTLADLRADGQAFDLPH